MNLLRIRFILLCLLGGGWPVLSLSAQPALGPVPAQGGLLLPARSSVPGDPARELGSGADGSVLLGAGPLPLLELLDDGSPLPPVVPFFPFLPPLPEGGVSLGTTSTGKLLQADALPLEHPSLRIMPRQKARNLHYGTRGMIQALVEAAEDVAQQHPGSILSLGDVAAVHGGDIWWSVSHNNGRDADIAFFYHNRLGEDVIPEDFISLDARGRSADRSVVFDPERTWTVVRSLILSPHISLQWLFISRPLREALLKVAQDRNEPPELIARAEELLGQPGDALAHNDHLHVRTLCAPLEVISGCMDMGRLPTWAPDPLPLRQARVEQLWGMLGTQDPERRGRAAELLGYLGDPSVWSGIEALLGDPEPTVQASAARGLELLLEVLPASVRTSEALGPSSEDEEGEGGEATEATEARVEQSPLPAVAGSPPSPLPPPGPSLGDDGTGGLGAPPEMPPLPELASSAPVSRQKPRELAAPRKTPLFTRESARARLASLLLRRLEGPLDAWVQQAFLAVLVRLEWSPTLEAPFVHRWLTQATQEPPRTSGGAANASTGLPGTVFVGQPGMVARGLPEVSSTRVLALRLIGELPGGAEPFLPVLRKALQDPDEATARAALESVALLTNRVPAEGQPLREQAARMGRWLDMALDPGQGCRQGEGGFLPSPAGPCSLEHWWLTGFQEAGFSLPNLNLYAMPVLEKALYAPFPLSMTAHRLMMRIAGTGLEHAPDSWEEVEIFWARWLKRNVHRVYPPAPKKTSSKKATSKHAGGKKSADHRRGNARPTSKSSSSKKGAGKTASSSKSHSRSSGKR